MGSEMCIRDRFWDPYGHSSGIVVEKSGAGEATLIRATPIIQIEKKAKITLLGDRSESSMESL